MPELPVTPQESAPGSCAVACFFSRWGFRWAYVLLIAFAACTLFWPMGRDQGIFASAGDTILHGGVPYRDIWEVKGPAAHYTAAAAIAFFGHNQCSLRLLDLILTAIGMAALWRVCANMADRFAAHLAVIFYLIWYWGLGYWHSTQPDGWLSVFQLLALLFVSSKENTLPAWRMVLAGACLAVVVLYKPPFIASGVIFLPAAWYGRATLSGRLGLLAMGLLGLALPLLLALLAFFQWGALHDLVEIQFTFNALVHRSSNPLSVSEHVYAIHRFITNKGVVFLIAAVLLGLIQLGSTSRRSAWMIILLLVVDGGLVPFQQKYFPYHWIPLFGPLALLVGVAAFRAREAMEIVPALTPAAHVRWQFGAILLMTAVAWNAADLARDSVPMLIGLARSRSLEGARRAVAGGAYVDQRRVAQYIVLHTARGDTLLQWGFDPLINYLADRRSPTRFGFNYPLVRTAGPLQQEWREQFLHALALHPPAYLVIAENDTNNLMLETSVQYMKGFPEFDRYVHENFRQEAQIGDYEIWRNKADAP